MDIEELRRSLDDGVVKMDAAAWQDLAPALEEVERHDTFIAGDLVIVRDGDDLLAVEAPSSTERVVRRVGDQEAVRAFVGDRLDTYERMWDGCGCKVEYYE
ncbi:MAG: hypothetical protein PVJ02_16685 [Gemmatimonadota bacterium]|jgi:hypothetical protein